jgi:hypothetical protein
VNLDICWLKDDALEEFANLPAAIPQPKPKREASPRADLAQCSGLVPPKAYALVPLAFHPRCC